MDTVMDLAVVDLPAAKDACAMSSSSQKELGKRVAFLRHKQGLSQKALGEMVGRSEGWVSQVERGVRKLDRVSVLDALSEALGAPIQVIEDPRIDVSQITMSREEGSLSWLLAGVYGLLFHDDPNLRPVDVDNLVARVAEVWTQVNNYQHKGLAQTMDFLLRDLETTSRCVEGPDRWRVNGARARAYYAAGLASLQLGEPAAAWVAIERGIASAESVADFLLMAEGVVHLTTVFDLMKRPDLVIEAARTAIEGLPDSASSDGVGPEDIRVFSLTGALYLRRAMAHAQSENSSDAYDYLDIARDYSEKTGDDRNDYNTGFGRTSVLLYEVSIAVLAGDAGRALSAAERVAGGRVSGERAVRLYIDVARACAQLQNFTGAASALRRAAEASQRPIIDYPEVQELVRIALRLDAKDPYLRELGRDLDPADQ